MKQAEQQTLPGAPADELTGTLGRFRYRAEDSGFFIAALEVDGHGEVAIKGSAPLGIPRLGARLLVRGAWQNDPRFGEQFAFHELEEVLPDDTRGQAEFMAHYLDGVGPTLAQRILEHFGPDAFDIIREQPHRLREIRGITDPIAERIHESYQRHAAEREALTYLSGMGITPRAIDKLGAHFGGVAAAAAAIRRDPYTLSREVDGYGFKRSDQIALQQGFELSDHRRVAEGLVHTLRNAADFGHTYYPAGRLFAEACSDKLLAVEPGDRTLWEVMEGLRAEKRLTWEHADDGVRVMLEELRTAETSIFHALVALEAGRHDALEAQERAHLNGAQWQAVQTVAAGCGLLLLTGAAGTGKTTVIRALLEMAAAHGLRFALAAPTGKAAKRMSEATGEEASTLHRLLAYDPGVQKFTLPQVDTDLLVVDEASMIDSRLMSALLERVRPETTRLVLVGDHNQLPPVGPGAPYRDALAAGAFTTVTLSQIMRTSEGSRIPHSAAAVLAGQADVMEWGADCTWVECDDAQRIPWLIAAGVAPARLAEQGFESGDVQVLAMMRDRGPISAKALNELLRAVFNPGADPVHGWSQFRIGDRVIFGRNDYEAGYVNGDQGYVRGVEGGRLVVMGDMGPVEVARDKSGDVSLAYAITVHKSQGSEWPYVVVPVHRTTHIMLQRNLLYTALTRGKQRVVLVGQREALDIACRNVSAAKRLTLLKEMLA